MLIITTIFFMACNNKEEECKTCNPQPNAIEQISFNLMNEFCQSEFGIIKGNTNDGYYREAVDKYGIDENLFQFIRKYCISKNLAVDNLLIAVVLYVDFPISQSLSVSDEHIKGISLYEVKGNRIMHRLYVRNEQGDFYEEENVNVSVPFVSFNHINFYLENYVFTDPQNKSVITLFGDAALEVEANRWKYDVPMQLEVVTKRMGGGDIICGYPCWPEENNKICQSTVTGARCQKVCSAGAVSDMLPYDPVLVTDDDLYLHDDVNLPLIYAFRDSVLATTAAGLNYITNYYYLSDEFEGR